jgi:hypothetical protein
MTSTSGTSGSNGRDGSGSSSGDGADVSNSERPRATFAGELSRGLPAIATIYLPTALLLLAPWSVFVVSYAEAVGAGWPGSFDPRYIAIGEESLSGMRISVMFTAGIILAAGIVGWVLARRRKLSPALVVGAGTLGVLAVGFLAALVLNLA